MSDIKNAICIKLHDTGTTLDDSIKGKILPIFHEDNIGWKKSTRDDFPRAGEIYVSKQYEQCDNNFKAGELFYVSWLRFNEDESDLELDNEEKALYWTLGTHCKDIPAQYSNSIAYALEYPHSEFSIEKISEVYSYPLSKTVFFRMPDGDLVGPFSTSEIGEGRNGYSYKISYQENSIAKSPEGYLLPKWPADLLPAVPKHKVSLIEGAEPVELIWNWRDLVSQTNIVEWIDAITDEQLVRWANIVDLPKSAKNKSRLSNKDRREFIQKVDEISKTDNETRCKRLERLGALVQRIDKWEEQKNNFISDLFISENEHVQKAIDEYLEGNSAWAEGYNEKIKEKKDTLRELDRQIEEKEKEVKRAAVSISASQSKEELEEISSAVQAKKRELQELATSEAFVKDNLDKLKTELKQYGKLENESKLLMKMEVKREYAQESYEKYLEEKSKLEKELKSQIEYRDQVRKELLEDDAKVVSKAAAVLPFIDRFKRKIEGAAEGDLPMQEMTSLVEAELNFEEACEKFLDYFACADYEITKENLLNYLTCVAQNYLTVFAGYPGVGKTTLTEHIGNALGLPKRTKLISVSRGWTSDRDILGYFNPLNSKYEEAPTELISRLVGLADEYNKNDDVNSAFFILDEANLSPIEHYWASFMPHCEVNKAKRISIKSGEQIQEIAVPENVRFLGTINIDNTTEMLSPRLLDRVPLIYVRPPEGLSEVAINNGGVCSSLNMSHSNFIDLFGKVPDDEVLTDDEEMTFESIVDILRVEELDLGKPVIVSYRKQKAIRSFVLKMNSYKVAERPQEALDLAVIQFLLPTLSGYGEGFGRRLHRLSEMMPDLVESKKALSKMILLGEENHYNYNYFSF